MWTSKNLALSQVLRIVNPNPRAGRSKMTVYKYYIMWLVYAITNLVLIFSSFFILFIRLTYVNLIIMAKQRAYLDIILIWAKIKHEKTQPKLGFFIALGYSFV